MDSSQLDLFIDWHGISIRTGLAGSGQGLLKNAKWVYLAVDSHKLETSFFGLPWCTLPLLTANKTYDILVTG